MGIGRELHYREYGAGPPLVILHGLLGSSGNWHTLASTVFGERFRVLAVDLRNHGRSPHTEAISYELLVEDLTEFLDAQGIERTHLLGHSLGGKVAMAFALEHPERVDCLVVADMAPRAYPPNHQYILDALRAVDPASHGSRSDVDAALAEHISAAPVRQFLLKNLARDAGSGQYRWQMNLKTLYRDYDRLNEAIRADGAIGDDESPEASGAVGASAAFTGPALFVRGAHSDYVQDSDEENIRRLFPSAEITTIPGAGHWVHADAPQALGEAVTAFLQRPRAGG